jgi:membrane peptidoglycan carboxypeptidase
VSNPDSPGLYWPESVPVGGSGAPGGRRREDPYDRGDHHARPAGGNGRPAGNGSYANGSYANGSYANGSYANGYAAPGAHPAGNGRPADPAGPPYGGRGPGAGPRRRGSQAGSELRSRLGLGSNGAPADGPGPETSNGGRAAPPRSGPGRRAARSSGGARADAELRSRLGLRSAPGSGSGRPPAGPGGTNGYANGHGPDGDGFDDSIGYGVPRGGTALRERGPAGSTAPTRTRGPRRGGPPGGSGGGRGGGRRPRRKGSWWRHWTWKKALGVAAGMVAGLILLFVAAVVYAYEKTPIPTDISEAALQQSSTVYFSNGQPVGTFTADGIDRQMLSSNQIPGVMKNAIVAAEDRHFYSEGGISLTGIMRSAYEDLKGGGNLQGGSTLTEEFAKNYYTTIGTSRTVSTKIKEIFVAIKLSHEKSKDWIITQYLNTVPFGNNAYGVAAAAQLYFDEPALKLTVSQAAMLAAMVNEPSFFSPDPSAGAGYTALVARWHYVLTNMVRDGALSQQEADAQTFPKVLTVNQLAASWQGYKGYVMAAVESELENTYGYTEQQIDTGGLKIVTTLNEHLMNALYAAVNQNLAQMRADGQPLPNYAHIGALLEKPGTGAILAFYGGPSFSARNCAKIKCQWNMAMQNREQVGSSFKPYVLATAVSEGMDVQDSILNGIEPMCIPPDSTLALRDTLSTETTNCPPDWFPVNIAGENSGPLSVPKAAAISSDPAFEDLIHKAGTDETVNMAKAFGVNTTASGLLADRGEVGMALGIASLTVEEQATTFATLANDGEYVTPHVIAQITENQNGTTVTIPLKVARRQVLTPAQAADVDYALSFDTSQGGTAFPNGVLNPNRPTIGKTGTTDDEQSAFFLGAIPQYSFAVGMFTNDQNGQPGGQSLGILPSVNGQPSGNGGNWPATIWQTYMQDEFSGLPIEPLPTPDYTGFSMWDQVPPQPAKPKPQPKPGQCPPGHRHFGLCPPGTQPNPLPTPPFGGGILGANAVGAVLLQAARIRRRRRRGGRTTGPSRSPGALPPSSG